MIAARLREIAEQDAAAPALIAGDIAISRAELNRAGAAARRRLAEAGLRPGGFALVSLPVSIEAAVVFVACAELGAIFLPVNAATRNEELSWLIGQAPPSLVIVTRDDFERWLEAGVDSSLILCVDQIVCPSAEEPPGDASPEWPADHAVASMLSSGSTGRPKIGLWTMARVLGISSAMARACSIGPGSRLLATVPLHHGHGLANGLMMPLLSGATVVLIERALVGRFDPLEAARAIERNSVDYLIGSPVLFNLLVDANVPASALCSLRVCLSGGAPLAPAVAEAWNRLCATPVRQAYGSSEAGMISIQSEDSADRECVGRPVPGTEIRIIDGEIAVRGPGLVTRYLGDGQVKFLDGFLLTGDRGRVDEEGLLYVSGRVRPWINTGGVKVDPVEVQRAIGDMPGVRECRVDPEPGPGGMEIVGCTIAPEPGVTLTRAAVIRHCRAHLAEFKIPRVIRFVTTIATDLTGKTRVPNLREVVESFIAGAIEPAMLDAGEEPLLLTADQWSLSEWNGRLVLQAWDERRNLVRKITGLKEQRRDRICLVTERFRNADAELQIADLAAPAGRELGRRTSRIAFRERFHLMLAREWPEWQVAEVSADANLEASLSTAYARAFLRLGSSGIAVMAAPPDAPACSGIVAVGLIWLDYLRRREKACSVGRLLVYVPLGMESEVAFRAACLDPMKVACQLFAFDENDRAGAIDFADAGNIDSTLPPCRRPAAPNSAAQALPDMPDVDQIEQTDGSVSLQVRGLEFARASAGKITCGISRRKRSDVETVVAMSREISRVRDSNTDDRQHPLYAVNPEGWLESQVRAHPETIDASLRSVPIYGQVPIFSGADRGVIDLLGIDHTGRLVVIELKATADLQLPFQALDYWLRVRKHLDAGDFERLGYFAGHVVSPEAPRILLVAPALEFHSTIETLLGALMPQIEVTRVGLAADWRSGLRVMFRLRGNERP